jgi:hypothetical protein
MLLAILTRTLLEWLGDRYLPLRQKRPLRQRLFNDIRTLTTCWCFDNWAAQTAFMLDRFERPSTWRVCQNENCYRHVKL